MNDKEQAELTEIKQRLVVLQKQMQERYDAMDEETQSSDVGGELADHLAYIDDAVEALDNI